MVSVGRVVRGFCRVFASHPDIETIASDHPGSTGPMSNRALKERDQ